MITTICRNRRTIPISMIRIYTIAIVISSFLVSPSSCIPLFMLYSAKPYCLALEAPEGTLLAINYEAPDINSQPPPQKGKHDKHKHHKSAPTITITQSTPLRHVRDYLPSATKNTTPKPKPLISTLSQTRGKILHKVSHDGLVSLCLRAHAASSSNPQRFGIVVTPGKDSSHYRQEEMEHHLDKISMQMMKLNDEMMDILAEADLAKEREVAYHDMSESMHAGAMYWPMLHVCVLLLVGVTQAGHMIRFFKSKNLV